MNNNCKLVNIIWIDRGIILSIINYITKHYEEVKDKNIIIDVPNYRYCLKTIYPELNIVKFTKHNKENFYFNIRKIIKKQDVIIDYLNNYDEYINTEKLHIIPWYDMNDILIIYKYNKNKKYKLKNYKLFIKDFSLCRRGNYINNNTWDFFIEKSIYINYVSVFNKNIQNVFNIVNYYTNKNYTNTVNVQNKLIPIYYKQKVEVPVEKVVEKIVKIPVKDSAEKEGETIYLDGEDKTIVTEKVKESKATSKDYTGELIDLMQAQVNTIKSLV